MMTFMKALRAGGLAASLLLSASCDSDPVSVTSPAGTYALTRLTTTSSSGAQTDLVAAGASGSLVLAADGSSSGLLQLPSTPELGPASTINLAGHWSQSAGTISVTTTADTFIRDIPLSWAGSQLTGDKIVGGMRVLLTFSH